MRPQPVVRIEVCEEAGDGLRLGRRVVAPAEHVPLEPGRNHTLGHLRAALAVAGVQGHVRAFHDLRHTAITNDATSGANPIAVMTKAGHADIKTTRRCMQLAGVVFRDETARLEERLLGGGPAAVRDGVT